MKKFVVPSIFLALGLIVGYFFGGFVTTSAEANFARDLFYKGMIGFCLSAPALPDTQNSPLMYSSAECTDMVGQAQNANYYEQILGTITPVP